MVARGWRAEQLKSSEWGKIQVKRGRYGVDRAGGKDRAQKLEARREAGKGVRGGPWPASRGPIGSEREESDLTAGAEDCLRHAGETLQMASRCGRVKEEGARRANSNTSRESQREGEGTIERRRIHCDITAWDGGSRRGRGDMARGQSNFGEARGKGAGRQGKANTSRG